MKANNINSEIKIMLVKSNLKHSYREYYIGSTYGIQDAEHFRIMKMESDLCLKFGKYLYCYKITVHTKELE